MRLRAGKTGSGQGRLADGRPGDRHRPRRQRTLPRSWPRRPSMYGSRAVVGTCVRDGAQFSLAMTLNTAIVFAIAAIPEAAWTPVRYPA